ACDGTRKAGVVRGDVPCFAQGSSSPESKECPVNEHTRRAARGLTVCALASSLVTAGFVGLGEASAAAGPAASSAGWQVTPLPPPSANLVGVGGTGRANETWATGFSISDGANGLAPIALRWNGTAWTQTPVPVQTDPAAQDTQTRLNSNPA